MSFWNYIGEFLLFRWLFGTGKGHRCYVSGAGRRAESDVFAVVGVAHVACLVEGVMERERGGEGVRGLTLGSETEVVSDLKFFHDRIVMRPAEISNNPEVIRRLGVIVMNTALEADLFGSVNSTHVLGTKMMNGIGGSGDFTRNAYISIFSCPSRVCGV